jgi:hypothetical protein
LVAGVNVGGGEAETVVYVCERGRDLGRIVAMGAWRGEDTRGAVVNILNRFRARLSEVRVDAIGIGHNFGHHLRDCGFKVAMVNVGLPCEHQPQLGDLDPAARFLNQKARFYQTLADYFERDQIRGLVDEATIGQLAGILSEIDSRGRLKIEPKERARARGVGSLDRAEALMLALCKPFERAFAPCFLADFAWNRREKGQSLEQIALGLEATLDEVKEWLAAVETAHRRPARSPFNYRCDFCGQPIGDDIPARREGSIYFHEDCAKKKMAGFSGMPS